MKPLYLFLFIILGLFVGQMSIYSQVVLKGHIVDEETSMPIPNVHVYDESSGKAAISDSTGTFMIEVPALPALMTFSHLTYYHKALYVEAVPEEGLKVNLTSKDFQINEVVVTGQKVQQFFRREGFFVKEMEFGDGFMWVIGYPGKDILKPELRLLSLGGNVLSRLKLDRPASLFRDAFSEVHLNFADSINQLRWDGDSIKLEKTFLKDGSEKYFFCLKASFDSLAILKLKSGTGVYNEYLAFNFLDSSQQVFHYSYDHDLFTSGNIAKKHKYGTIPDIRFPSFMPGISARETPTFDPSDAFTGHAQDRLLTYTPINSKLFILENQLIIFEDKGPFIWKYGLDLTLKGMETIHVPEKSHKLDLLQDPLSRKLFLIFENRGQQYISGIDEDNGKLIKTIRINGFTFIENIRIYGNRVYYLDQSRIGSQTMNLYSMAIE